MKSIFVAFVIFVVGINAFAILEDDIHSQWQQFKTKHARSYSVSEDLKRKAIFSQNVEKISSHNKLYDEGRTTFKLGVNAFTDMTEEEYKQRLGFRAPRKAGSKNLGLVYDDTVVIVNITGSANGTLPSQVDWRTSGAVTGVKDQGACGSCWAFSATGALEGQYFLKNNKNASLSEKNLVDCSHESINIGCGGGDMVGAFQYVHNNDGIDDEDHYPYSATDGECLYDPDYNVTSTSIVVLMAQLGNEDALKFLVALYGPIAVAIDADHPSFQWYASGVYYEENCISAEEDPLGLLDHGVLLVGYGTDTSGNDYWLVKNSWGHVWGDDGYIKMARNRNNNCGIASYASVPLPYLN